MVCHVDEPAGEATRHGRGRDQLLVLEAPHEHARVVAVAADQLGEVGEAFIVRLEPAVLVEHEQAVPIAGVEDLGCGRMMRGAVRVAPQLLELRDLVLVHAVGEGDPDPGEVLVAARSLDRQRAPFSTSPSGPYSTVRTPKVVERHGR